MYHPAAVTRARDALEAQLPTHPNLRRLFPTGLVETPVGEARERIRELTTLMSDDGRLARPLTYEEEQFIVAESLLGKIDWAYWAERYGVISLSASSTGPMYPLWNSQRLVLRELGRIEEDRWKANHPDGILVLVLKARQLGACLSPDTRILTADLRWVAIDTLRPGDTLVATDEFPPGGRGSARKMRTASVEARADVFEPAFELAFDNGQRVVATAPHRFLCRRRNSPETQWRAVSEMRAGDVIRYATTPWGESNTDDWWFGGLLDGEGCLHAERKRASGAEVNVSQVDGLIYREAEAYLRSQGYTYRVEADPATRPSKFGSRPVNKLCLSRIDEIFRLLGQTRPRRFLPRFWWEGKELPGKRAGFGYRTLTAITPLGPRRMVDLQTSTKTFIAEGLISHNSTLAEGLVAHRTTTHADVQALIASDEPDSSARMYRIYERFIDHLPWWMRPSVKFDVKNAEKAFGNGSRVEVDAGKSTRGTEGKRGQLGRSGTYSVLHLTEVSTWENPGQIDDALMPAVPFSPSTLAIFESTAKGYNWWYRLWELAERGQAGPSGHSFAPIFIPWYAEPEKYWLPAPTSWSPNATTLAMASRATEFGPRWMGGAVVHLAREQLYWYEFSRTTAEEKERTSEPGSLAKFLEEYPSDPAEAFQHGGRSLFSVLVREDIRTHARPLANVCEVLPAKDLAFAWAGRRPGLDYDTRLADALTARGIDPTKWDNPMTAPGISPQLAAFNPETDPLRLPQGSTLRPISRREFSAILQLSGLDALLALEQLVLIWEAPKRSELYVIGVDVAEGIEADRSVVEVTRVGTIERPDEEVAQFVSSTIDPVELAYVVDVLGRLYAGKDGREALVAIECNNFGLQTQSELLRHLGYTNFFQWQYEDAATLEGRYTRKFGWWTSVRTRPLIVGRLIRAVKTRDDVTQQRDIQINSPHTIHELQHFQQPAGEGMAMARAASGGHDDCLMALAIAIHCAQTLQFEQGEPIADRRRRLQEEAFRANLAAEQARLAGTVDGEGRGQIDWRRLEPLSSTPRRAQNTDVSVEELDERLGTINPESAARWMETDRDEWSW